MSDEMAENTAAGPSADAAEVTPPRLSRLCSATTKDGKPCGAIALKGGDRCAFHEHPDMAVVLGAKGGANRRQVLEAADLPDDVETAGDVKRLLAVVVSQVLTGQIATQVANSAGYLLTTMLRAVELADHEDRLAAIEESLGLRKAGK